MNSDRQSRISERAYQLWESDGFPEGEHQNHWLRAEKELNEAEGSEGHDKDVPQSGTIPAPTPDIAKKD